MSKYEGAGQNLTFTAPAGGVVADTALLIGSLLVVPTETVAATLPFVGVATGLYRHAKTSAQAWAEGVKLYWDDTNKVITTTATGNTLVGVAAEAAVNPSATGLVRLDGMAR